MADLRAVQDARHAVVRCPEPGCTRKRGDAVKVTDAPRGFVAPCPRCRGAGVLPDPAFDAALARLAAVLDQAEQETEKTHSGYLREIDAIAARYEARCAALTKALTRLTDKAEAYTGGYSPLASFQLHAAIGHARAALSAAAEPAATKLGAGDVHGACAGSSTEQSPAIPAAAEPEQAQ